MSEGDGATSLEPDERAGLRLAWIATRGDLNAAESQNIAQAVAWVRNLRPSTDYLLSAPFLRKLHEEMFGDVWTWAGRFRTTERNIGMDPIHISVQVANLVEDLRFWLGTVEWSLDEAAARFHHRLVAIHPFPNGNGRHARLATDLLLESRGARPFTWGYAGGDPAVEVRPRYLAALRSADQGDLGDLLNFVRS